MTALAADLAEILPRTLMDTWALWALVGIWIVIFAGIYALVRWLSREPGDGEVRGL